MLAFLQGKKSYILAAGAAVTAIGTYLGGGMTESQLVEALFAAAALASMRAAVTKGPQA